MRASDLVSGYEGVERRLHFLGHDPLCPYGIAYRRAYGQPWGHRGVVTDTVTGLRPEM